MKLADFKGTFGDWETFVHDVELGDWVVRVLDPNDNRIMYFYYIVGSTVLPNQEILLMLTKVDLGVDVDTSLKRSGVEFMTLSDALKRGLKIVLEDQY